MAAYVDRKSGGKLLLSGSVKMFEDEFIDKEDNTKILDAMLGFLTERDHDHIGESVREETSITDYYRTPDTS